TELDTLAAAFNTMASRLDNTEQTRRRLLADLAHEMATPVSVLTAYVEGLQDQVVKWNSTTSTVMTEHLARLTRLVSDLDLVSRVEEHQMELEFSTIQISEFINRAASAIQEKSASKGITLRVESNPTELTVRADYQRLSQVL